MLKEAKSLSTNDMMEPTRDGRFSILIKPRRLLPRDKVKNSVCKSTDHSTSFLDYH